MAVDTSPGTGASRQLNEYWTAGAGLAKWRGSPKPWTTLRDLLAQHMPMSEANGLATEYYVRVFGHGPGKGQHHGKAAAMVNLVTVPNVELMKIGKWDISTGEWTVTPALIAAAIDAHSSGVLRKPVIRLGHNDARFSGDPAVGYVDNLRASADGSTLIGDLVGMPQWLGDIMASAYPDRSIEGLYDYTAPDGSEYPFILTGLALLGATRPGVESLQSLQDVARLYDIAAAGRIGGTAVEFTVSASTDPSAPEAEVNKGKEGIMPTLNEGLAQKLGIAADADDETILKAVDEALTERAETPPSDDDKPAPAPVEQAPAEPQPEPVAAASGTPVKVVNDVVQLDQASYDNLVAAAADGRAAREQQVREDDARIVEAAITTGKVPPARKQHWLDSLAADREGTTAVLASLKPGLIPLAEIGHGVSAEATEDDVLYASLYGKDA
jgi:hypothetical protein